MPAKSEKQRKFMAMCYSNPYKARGKCPSKSVAHEFMHKGTYNRKKAHNPKYY